MVAESVLSMNSLNKSFFFFLWRLNLFKNFIGIYIYIFLDDSKILEIFTYIMMIIILLFKKKKKKKGYVTILQKQYL